MRLYRNLIVSLCVLGLVVSPGAYFVYNAKAEVQAETLHVNALTTLRKQGSPYLYSNVIVEPEGTLVIEPGVHLMLSAGATIAVHGTLMAIGTVLEKIVIEALQAEAPWQTLYASSSAINLQISYVDFRQFVGPIYLEPRDFAISDLSFEDGQNNVLHLGSPGSKYPDTMLNSLSFVNRLQGRRMQDSGVNLEGSYGSLQLFHIFFHDLRVSDENRTFRIGVWVSATRKSLQFVDVRFSLMCSVAFLHPLANESVYLGDDPKTCHPEKMPVLFVPGYGTSINLSQLSKTLPVTPRRDGWKFPTPATQSYKDLLNRFADSKTPYAVCFYDWRLPAAQIVEEYLMPAIQDLKQANHTDAVKIVAHSYGGLVARAYVQSSEYQGDVFQVVQLGTPNQGAAKAYGLWEGGELPADWQVLDPLLRYYQYVSKEPTRIQTIRSTFPSVREMLPIYPSLYYRRTELIDPKTLRQPNSYLLSLRGYLENFLQRTRVTTIHSQEKPTVTSVLLKLPPSKISEAWPDGEPYKVQPAPPLSGDGTVPAESVILEGAQNLTGSGGHAELPSKSIEQVFAALSIALPAARPENSSQRMASNMLWFIFDCPITVSITLPNGTVVTSADNMENENYSVFASDEMTWMILPELSGTYSVSITGLEDAPVRYWVNQGDIRELSVHKEETVVVTYPDGSVVTPQPVQNPPPTPKTDSTSLSDASPNPASPVPTPENVHIPSSAAADTAPHLLFPQTQPVLLRLASVDTWLKPWVKVKHASRDHSPLLPPEPQNNRSNHYKRLLPEWLLSILLASATYVLAKAAILLAYYCRCRRNVPP